MRDPGTLFLWLLLFASLVLVGMGARGIFEQRAAETVSFTPYLVLLSAMPIALLFTVVHIRVRERWPSPAARPDLFNPTVGHRSRLGALGSLGLLWLLIAGSVVHFHVLLGQRPTALSLGALTIHMGMGVLIASLVVRSTRRFRYLDDPTMALDAECQLGDRFTATVAQPLRRAIQLEKWEIALICEETERRIFSRVPYVTHEDRRTVVTERAGHRGEILHGGGAFPLPADALPSSSLVVFIKRKRRVVWYLESAIKLQGLGTFESRFPLLVHSAQHLSAQKTEA